MALRVRKLAQLTWRRPDGTEGNLLTGEEAYNLTISKGTLPSEERKVINNHIDPDRFDLFVRRKIYRRYADRFLHPEQIDEVDHARIPGYAGP